MLMLPMVLSDKDVEEYVGYVNGRTKVCIMVETAQALARIDDILAVKGVDEIFIGLNDLHISMGLSFMFELLSDGLVEYVANKCKAKGVPFGFGGIARIGDGMLPAERILAEHVRLGSSSVILSRTFKVRWQKCREKVDLSEEVQKVRTAMDTIKTWSVKDYQQNCEIIAKVVKEIINR